MEGLYVLMVLGLITIIIGGGILGFVSFIRVNKLTQQVESLKRQLSRQTPHPTPVEPAWSEPEFNEQADSTESAQEIEPEPTAETEPQAFEDQYQPPPSYIYERPQWQQHLIDNWMIWLGGISVALAGVFMVKYSINVGLMGPKTQIALAMLTGVVLHIVADWLRRKTGESSPVFASLAGGASITLYAALLAALHIYQLIPANWVFIGLAVVSLATMVMAILHGPMLAMIGLIGAYVVPILVSTGSGNVFAALIYSLIISASALLLIKFVRQTWLWWSVLVGAMCWWWISLYSPQAELFRPIYLALLAWMLFAIPHFNWLLKNEIPDWHVDISVNDRVRHMPVRVMVFALLLGAWTMSLSLLGVEKVSFLIAAPMIVMSFMLAQHKAFWMMAWLSLLLQSAVWILSGIELRPDGLGYQISTLAAEQQPGFIQYMILMAALYSGLATWQWLKLGFSHERVALTLLSPLVWLALAYILINGLAQSLSWSLSTLTLGLLYAAIAGFRLEKSQRDGVVLWLTLAAHVAYSLAITLFFREATLTLALAAQLISLCWLIRRYELPWLPMIVKVLLAIVVFRLTFNPWFADYDMVQHWTLWTYGGATLFAFLALCQLPASNELRRWLEAATLHLLVLTLGSELRYWLYDGDVFAREYSLTEAAINSSLWAALGLTYWWRAKVSTQLATLYQSCSRILIFMALGSYALVATNLNPLLTQEEVSSFPIFNLLLLAYGAPVLWAIIVAYYHDPAWRQHALKIAGIGLLMFISIEIRQLWQGSMIHLDMPTSDGELYTYSVVWMLLAIGTILASAYWQSNTLNKAGMGLLAVVIGKIFLVDMAGLDGLWRVAAFMGLGLALLALAWLYKRVGVQEAKVG